MAASRIDLVSDTASFPLPAAAFQLFASSDDRDFDQSLDSRMLTEPKTPEIPEWLHELYPFRTRTAMLDGYRMSFVDEGPADARQVLILHGNPTWSFLYRKLIKEAALSRRIIAPDNIGFGLSEKPRDPGYHTLERHIQNLTSLVDQLGLKDITLVAHGWGGSIGLGFAVRHPESIARVVLCSTWALPVANADRIKVPFRMRLANGGRISRYLDSVLNLSVSAAIASRMFSKPSDWTLEGYKYPFPTTASRVGISEFSRMFFKPSEADRATMLNTYSGLARIVAPADILVGDSDPLMTRLPAYLLRDALPNAHDPIFLPNTSHLLPEDAPDGLANVVLKEPPAKAPANKTESLFRILK